VNGMKLTSDISRLSTLASLMETKLWSTLLCVLESLTAQRDTALTGTHIHAMPLKKKNSRLPIVWPSTGMTSLLTIALKFTGVTSVSLGSTLEIMHMTK